uniref:FlgM domain-containing protein n=1 Tax=Rhabditophanes sp. KR3021 TaxID=114890 RepID=A0AC35U268_9BILA
MNKVVFWSLTYKRFLASVPKKLSDVKFSESKAYAGFDRQENDLDRIFNTPGHILSSNLERRMIRVQIEEAVASGKDTSLLEAELAYIDVKEAALKVKFEN